MSQDIGTHACPSLLSYDFVDIAGCRQSVTGERRIEKLLSLETGLEVLTRISKSMFISLAPHTMQGQDPF